MEKQRQELTECYKKISELEAAYEGYINARNELQKELLLANEKCSRMEDEVQETLKTLAQVNGQLDESQSRNEQYRAQVT
jgi:septal ring factor EnvC (AmiA/AmiB activator)